MIIWYIITSMDSQPKKWPPVPTRCFPPLQGGGIVRNSSGGAKNHWIRKGHHWTLNICTYNVHTLMADEKLKELEHEIDNIKWDIVGLGKVRRKDERKYS